MDSNEINNITGKWDHASLPGNVRLGSGCFLERRDSFKRFRSTRQPGLILGSNVKVYTWTEFNIEPQGFAQIGNDTTLVGAIFMCGEQIQIGNRVVISYNTTIADSDFHPQDPTLRQQDAIANAPHGDRSQRPHITTRPVLIEDDVWIGIGAIILKGVHIGKGARIGAGAVVTSNIPAGAQVSGNPARITPQEATA